MTDNSTARAILNVDGDALDILPLSTEVYSEEQTDILISTLSAELTEDISELNIPTIVSNVSSLNNNVSSLSNNLTTLSTNHNSEISTANQKISNLSGEINNLNGTIDKIWGEATDASKRAGDAVIRGINFANTMNASLSAFSISDDDGIGDLKTKFNELINILKTNSNIFLSADYTASSNN